MRVHDGGAAVIVDVAGDAVHLLDARNAFLLGLVREHHPADHVADRVDAGDVGLIVRIDAYEPFRIERHADAVEPQLIRDRAATYGDQHLVHDLRAALFPVARLPRDVDLAILNPRAGGGRAEAELD